MGVRTRPAKVEFYCPFTQYRYANAFSIFFRNRMMCPNVTVADVKEDRSVANPKQAVRRWESDVQFCRSHRGDLR